MDYRLLLSALTVENVVAAWPAIFLILGFYSDWFLFLVVLPVAVVITSSGLVAVGIARKGKITWKLLNWLIIVSVLPIVGTLISLFFFFGLYNWAAEDRLFPSSCQGSFDVFKCIIVQGSGYVDLYLLGVVIVAIVAFISLLPKYHHGL